MSVGDIIFAGEVALPGGKAEEGDKDDGDTAKREAREEIGLDPELVNVVTVLEPFLSKVCVLFNSSLAEVISITLIMDLYPGSLVVERKIEYSPIMCN